MPNVNRGRGCLTKQPVVANRVAPERFGFGLRSWTAGTSISSPRKPEATGRPEKKFKKAHALFQKRSTRRRKKSRPRIDCIRRLQAGEEWLMSRWLKSPAIEGFDEETANELRTPLRVNISTSSKPNWDTSRKDWALGRVAFDPGL